MIYEADCHSLKTNQKTDIKISDYFLWKERSLFDFTISFDGENKTNNEYGLDGQENIITTVSYEYGSSVVINNKRENKTPSIRPDGTYEFKQSDSFNPAGAYGKIKDADLIRIRHNPCFDCEFTAYVSLRKNIQKLVVVLSTYDGIPPTPTPPDQTYYQWQIVRGPDLVYSDDSGRESYGYLINASKNVPVSFTMQIHPGVINEKTREVGQVFTFGGRATQSENNSNAKIKVGSVEYNGLMQIEDGISSKIEWKPNRKRPS
jgi:hypothetical protein